MHKDRSLPKQSLFMVITVLAIVPFIVPHLALANPIILFQDEFEDRKLDVTGKWHPVSGQWAIANGRLVQTAIGGKSLIIVTDNYWDETWVDYWFYSTVRIVEGVNGPLIFWRYHSDGSEGGAFGDNLPPRMKKSNQTFL